MKDLNFLQSIASCPISSAPPIHALLTYMSQLTNALCASLPAPLVSDAKGALSRYAWRAAAPGSTDLNFYQCFYAPAWSWIHWIADAAHVEAVVAGQAAMLLLHLLDDHLCDVQIGCSPLLLQLRTAAWLRFQQCAAALGADRDEGKLLWQSDLCHYFAASHRPALVTNLDAYCVRARHQTATGVIIPTLALRQQGRKEEADALREVLFHLGVAWRLLDDVRDAHADWLAGEDTILYILLRKQVAFQTAKAAAASPEEWSRIVQLLFARGVFMTVLRRSCDELGQAIRLATDWTWTGLADELCQMRSPIEEFIARNESVI